VRLTIRRGADEVTFDDPTANALDLGAVLPQLLRAFPDPAKDGVHVDATGQNERADTWPDSTVHPLGFQPPRS
jgi:hypothetical protein